jgi:hypothetical protein
MTMKHAADDDSPVGTETPKRELAQSKSTRTITSKTETEECTRAQETKSDDVPNEKKRSKRVSLKKNVEPAGEQHKSKSMKKNMDTEKEEMNGSDTPKPKRKSIKTTSADAAEESGVGGNDAPKTKRKSIKKKACDIDDLDSKIKKVQISDESEAVNESQERKLKRTSSRKSLQIGVGSEVVDGMDDSKIKQKSPKKKQELEESTEIIDHNGAPKLKRKSSKKKLTDEEDCKAAHENDAPKLKRKSSSKKKLGKDKELDRNKVAAKESNHAETTKKSNKVPGSKLTPPKRSLSTGTKTGKISEDSRVVNHLYDDNIFDSAKMFFRKKLGKS